MFMTASGQEAGTPVEAYVTVPVYFTPEQREAIVSAGTLAGIKIINVVEEPLAALYSVKRLEQTGNFLIVDCGDTIRSYLIRVASCKPTVIPSSITTHDWLSEIMHEAETNHVLTRAGSWIKRRDQGLLYREQLNDELIDHFETTAVAGKMISRERRQLATFQPIYNASATLFEKIQNSLPSGFDIDNISHSILIGGGSMAAPELGRSLEKVYRSRLGDLNVRADQAQAAGAAIIAAQEHGVLKTIYAGERTVNPQGRYQMTPKGAVDTFLQEYKFATAFNPASSNYPLPVPLAPENFIATLPVEPLYPEYRSAETPLRPEPAISYAQKKDPVSGKVEHWARLSVKAPFPPPSDADRPNLKVLFVLNITGTPTVNQAADVPENVNDWEGLNAHTKEQGLPSLNYALSAGSGAGYESAARDQEKKAKFGLMHKMQYAKNQAGASYRIQNRAIETAQTIMSQLDPRRDFVGALVVGSGTNGLGFRSNSMPIQRIHHQDNDKLIEILKTSDCSGRAGERYGAAIAAAQEIFAQHSASPLPDPALPPAPAPSEYDIYHLTDEELQRRVKAEERPITQIPTTPPTGAAGDGESASPAAPEETNKEKAKPVRTELRIVFITDQPPDPSRMEDAEAALINAAKEDILTTVVSIDGPAPESQYYATQSRVRGMKTLRWFRKTVTTHAFRKQWLYDKKLISTWFTESPYRSVVLKVEFEKYKIAKMYGGPLTVSERTRLERSPPTSVRFKYGTVDTTYKHSQVDPELDWTPTPDNPCSVLFKLEPTTQETAFEREMRLNRDSPSSLSPSSGSSLSTIVSNDFSPQSRVSIAVSFLDAEGEKREYERSIWLADDAVPGYADESGVENLVWAVKFGDFLRSAVHSNLVAAVGDASIMTLPSPSKEIGIPHLSQKVESQLLQLYGADSSEAAVLVKKAAELSRAGVPPISDAAKLLLDDMYGQYVETRVRQAWLEGENRDDVQFVKNLERDPIIGVVWALREAFYGQQRPNPVVSLSQIISRLMKGLSTRDKVIQSGEDAHKLLPPLFQAVAKYRGDGEEVWNERKDLEGRSLDLVYRVNKKRHPYEIDFIARDYAARAAFWFEDNSTMWSRTLLLIVPRAFISDASA